MKRRLENWASWKVRSEASGLGYARSSVLLAIPTGGYREPVIPVDEIDAEVTDRAVESLKLGKGHLHMTLHLVYVRGTGVKGAAKTMRRAESTIKAQLEQADAALAMWFDGRNQKRTDAKNAGGFTP